MKPVSKNTLLWVLVAQATSIFPLLFQLPLWVAVVWWVALVWRVQIFRGRLEFPNAVLKILLGALCVGLVYGSYSGVVGVEPMVGFLVCSFILKLIELRTRKDALIILFIGFIAIAAQFLFAQGVVAAVYGLVAFVVLLSAWRAVIAKRPTPWRRQLRVSAQMFLQSLPMLLLLFVIMPRIGPLWSVPMPQGHGQTGFSDSLKLGDIGKLVKSYEVAFHATFEGLQPSPGVLYWRGLVLDEFDGQQWRARDTWSFAEPKQPANDVPKVAFDYSIVMEPHFHSWLFSLGYPTSAESSQVRINRTKSGLLSSISPVTQKIQYRVTSSIGPLNSGEGLRDIDWLTSTEFPSRYNPKTQTLARQWRAAGLSSQQIVDAALERFKASFFYTLAPPTLGLHAVDDFLFGTQKGFCEHFASSFVLLMRAANIPSRVVVGYQGGQLNPEGFMTVRQSDAHAWAEVWLQGEGWVRVDPTAAVVPERILSGVEEALGAEDRQTLYSAHWQKRWLIRFNQRWDALSYSWQRWVLNYDNAKKDAFISRWLGSLSPWRIGLAFIAVCLLAVALVALGFFLTRTGRKLSPEDKLLRRVFKRLGKEGMLRSPGEPLKGFMRRSAAIKPDYERGLLAIAEAYYATRYGESRADLERLTLEVGKFLKRPVAPAQADGASLLGREVELKKAWFYFIRKVKPE